MTSRGQVAYEAYCQSAGWVSQFTGDRLPEWVDVKPEVQEHWEAAAAAVADQE
jgi:hypothetical protein